MNLVAIATYNEIENLPRLVADLLQRLPETDVLVIDDNSPDGTGRWCDQYAAEDPRLKCLHRPGKLGLGTATVAGLQYAIDHGYRLVLTMDADWSHDPRYAPLLIEALQLGTPDAIGLVIGSRYVAGGGIEDWPWTRRLTSRMINSFARWWLGLAVRDTSGAFRCYCVEALRKLDLQRVQSRGYSVYEELLWRLRQQDVRMLELPITFVDRHYGRSKITVAEAWRSVAQLVKLRFPWLQGSEM
jgi:dolichol-phosphate mannosyltransferase